MIVALPFLKDRLAPCFEAAREFILAEIDQSRVISTKRVACSGSEGFHRIRLLRVHDVEALICNGIKEFYLDLLLSINIDIYPSGSGSIDEILAKFAAGNLRIKKRESSAATLSPGTDLESMIEWARDIFTESGYKVYDGPGQDSFLIDLIAEIECPQCGKQIRLAVCCGAHTYSTEQEIQEFNYCSKATYNGRVFVYPGDKSIAKRCHEFGIELIEPFCDEIPGFGICRVPLLTLPIEGHPELNHEKI